MTLFHILPSIYRGHILLERKLRFSGVSYSVLEHACSNCDLSLHFINDDKMFDRVAMSVPVSANNIYTVPGQVTVPPGL